jgi:putative transposase
MARKRFKPEQIIHMLREAEVKLAGGSTTPEACRALGISEQTYYRWCREYGGMQVSQANLVHKIRGDLHAPCEAKTPGVW